MLRYGTDKPDLRFGLEIEDATEVTRGSEFGVFANAPAVRFLARPRAFSRAGARSGSRRSRRSGARRGSRTSCSTRRRGALADREVPLRGRARGVPRSEPGTTVLFAADTVPMVARVLGAPAPPARRGARPDRPTRTRSSGSSTSRSSMARRGDGAGRSSTTPSRPDAGPRGPDRERPGARVSQHYDLIWNGWELGSGLDPDPPPRTCRSGSSARWGCRTRSPARSSATPPRRAADGRAAARRLRARDRALRSP